MSESALRCRGLQKRYADVVAVAGLDLEVGRGECFGLLGPNGAGKTTTIEILEGLTSPDGGDVEVLGEHWGQGRDRQLRARLGIQLQETQLNEKLTVEETLRLFRSFYPRGPQRRRRARPRRAGKQTRKLGRQALGRPEAAARGRLRPGRRSRAAVSRRADDGPRSAVAPAAVGPADALQGRRRHDPADDALHGRSGDALRSRRHRRSGQGHRPRHAARAGRLARRRARRRVPARRWLA